MNKSKFEYRPLERVMVANRRHYLINDEKLPSVTTILEATKPEADRQGLANWRKAVGDRRADEITNEAACRGTRMHAYLEKFILNDRQMPKHGTNPWAIQAHKMATIVAEKGLSNVSEFWGTELPLYYPGLYAGTTDCAGVWKGRDAIVDFKQTNKPKTIERVQGYYKQLIMYGLAHNKLYGTNIKTGVIMMCSKDFEYQEFELSGSDWDKYEELMWDDVETYYREHHSY